MSIRHIHIYLKQKPNLLKKKSLIFKKKKSNDKIVLKLLKDILKIQVIILSTKPFNTKLLLETQKGSRCDRDSVYTIVKYLQKYINTYKMPTCTLEFIILHNALKLASRL